MLKEVLKIKNADYWYLYWQIGIEWINQLIREALVNGEKERVEMLCRVFVIKRYNLKFEEV